MSHSQPVRIPASLQYEAVGILKAEAESWSSLFLVFSTVLSTLLVPNQYLLTDEMNKCCMIAQSAKILFSN